MADGEIELRVNAEGVEDAAGELGGAADGMGGDGGAPGGGGRGGDGNQRFGKLLGRIAGVLVFLGPILDVLEVVSRVLQAFMVPVALLLLRFLQPFLRLAISALPFLFDMYEQLDRLLEKFGGLSLGFMLAVGILRVISGAASAIRDATQRARDFLSDIDSRIGEMLDSLRNLGVGGGGDGDGGGSGLGGLGSGFGGRVARGAASGFATGGPGGAVGNVVLQGGLETFVDRVSRDGSIDF